MSSYKSFETERLILRPVSLEDAAFIFELMNSPKWIQYIGNRKIHSLEDAKSYILTKMNPQLERLGFSNYTVITKKEHHKIGTCGLYDREGMEGIDIGFAFLPTFEKLGYAFEASEKLKKVAFDVFQISEIKAITTKDNFPSQKLLIKLGLELKGHIKLPNDDEELLLYQLENKAHTRKSN